ncbi:MAG: DUF839 domain-containing protein [Verrucomicrobia bacterium]|nr:DUF839 domain-containing protein [Verrucomicrobiota bacterium]
MIPMKRRHFLERGVKLTAAFSGLKLLAATSAQAFFRTDGPDAGLESDFYGTIDLRRGFSYHIISETGDRMSDGLLTPGSHDGMGAFAGSNGRTILVRNHELDPGQNDLSPFGTKRALLRKIPREKLYDAGKGKKPALGGTTTLVYDTREKKLERSFLSLAGTTRNCAGGVTPWGSWITCEETTDKPNASGQSPDDEMEKEHGYNFEVPAREDISLAEPIPLKAMGRFRHEAIAVDPRSGVIYQTEDTGDGLFYRFIPKEPGRPAAGGRLQALKLRDLRRADTRNWFNRTFKVGSSHAVEWVDIQNVESPDDDLRHQGYYERGAARFARSEGCWQGLNSIFFAATSGGSKKKGQIWRYTPSSKEAQPDESAEPGTLELFIEPDNGSLIENADNLTIAPWGDLILCEDGVNPQYIVGVTPKGKLYTLAKTTLGELAGATFSPDATTLFVNIQTPGITLAITGPWDGLQRQIQETS